MWGGEADPATPRRCPQQRNQEEPEVWPLREGFLQRLRRAHASRLDLGEDGRFFHLKTDIKRDHDQDDGNQERNAPAVTLEICRRHVELEEEHSDNGKEQGQRSRDLNIAWRVGPLVIGNVLRNINRGASVFPAQLEPLEDTNKDQSNRSKPTGRGESGHQADEKGSKAHHRERDQEGILAAYQVAYSSEEERPKGAHQRSKGEGRKVDDIAERGVSRRIEVH